ncbi:UDP-glucose 4-epimerase [Colletotrichum shisoi]|uniref:UDP-glucose 4-epimerase n=1 Tax=Colletotrichum shisoi TaxID=2078593 RepID=A0A5Q4BTB3_9PEZI|nr:UDP-glucose 4-epimerase [Colletotrichum shisoi]
MASPLYTVLVTGSAGHLGAALMLSLPSLGHVPLGIDILPSPTTTVVGSVTDRALIASLLARNPSIAHIVHAATLHKPHVDSHPHSAFVDTNVTGTLVLLEEAASAAAALRLPRRRIASFVFISTTSAFGGALSPRPGWPAAWIDESVAPVPKNIYGVTKCAAEDLCALAHRQSSLPVLVLRTARFFPEADVGFGKYIISAPPPFSQPAIHHDDDDDDDDDRNGKVVNTQLLRRLDEDAGAVLREAVPECAAVFEKLGWGFLERLDRVYDSSKAVRELGWKPEWTFEKVVERLARGEDWRSELTHRVGKKGYHAVPTGVYTS